MYKTIHELPFLVFKQIMLTQDLSLLGGEDPLEREGVWQALMEQYAEALGEKDQDGYLAARRELLHFETQQYLAETLVHLLKDVYVVRWGNLLNKISGSQFKFDPHNREEYFGLLERSLKRCKGTVGLQISIAREKLRELEKKHEGTDLKPTEEFFQKVLLNLHEFSNWQFSNSDLTTYQYCELVRRYMQHLDYLEAQKQKSHARN